MNLCLSAFSMFFIKVKVHRKYIKYFKLYKKRPLKLQNHAFVKFYKQIRLLFFDKTCVFLRYLKLFSKKNSK